MLLNYQQFNAGHGLPLVVIHGLFGAQDNWRSHILRWSEDRHVISMDLRNHGRSDHAEAMTYAAMAEDVIETLNHIGISKAHILGHSMGGKVAAQIAFNQPQVLHSLIMADIAPVPYAPRHQSVLAGLRAIDLATLASRKQGLDILNQHEADIKVCQFLIKSLYRNDEGDFAWRFNIDAIEDQYDYISAAPEGEPFTGHTLALKGDRSEYILPEHRPVFANMLPNTQLKVMTDCGHWLHAEKPDLFVRLVNRFLQQVETPA